MPRSDMPPRRAAGATASSSSKAVTTATAPLARNRGAVAINESRRVAPVRHAGRRRRRRRARRRSSTLAEIPPPARSRGVRSAAQDRRQARAAGWANPVFAPARHRRARGPRIPRGDPLRRRSGQHPRDRSEQRVGLRFIGDLQLHSENVCRAHRAGMQAERRRDLGRGSAVLIQAGGTVGEQAASRLRRPPAGSGGRVADDIASARPSRNSVSPSRRPSSLDMRDCGAEREAVAPEPVEGGVRRERRRRARRGWRRPGMPRQHPAKSRLSPAPRRAEGAAKWELRDAETRRLDIRQASARRRFSATKIT